MKKICLIIFLASVAVGQQATKPKFMDAGAIQHNPDNTASVISNDPQPLRQAILAIREEYGWAVNYEMPEYFSHYDLVDNTAPQWRAAHPLSKGVTRAAGGQFNSVFPETANIGEEELLKKVISDYNSSGNPGKFELRKEGDKQYSVVGIAVKDEDGRDRTVTPLLDAPITMPSEQRTVDEAVTLLFSLLSSQTGKKVILGRYPSPEFIYHSGIAGGENVPARALLRQIFALTGRPLEWDVYYHADPDPKVYMVNVDIAKRPEIDDFGRRMLVPIDFSGHLSGPPAVPPTPKPNLTPLKPE